MAPQSSCGYINIHEHTWAALGCGPNSTRKSFNPEYWHQALASPRIRCQARQITTGSPLWRDLTKVISILPRLTCLGHEATRASVVWEASTLAKIYSNSLLITIRNVYIWAHDSFIVYEYFWRFMYILGSGIWGSGGENGCPIKALTCRKSGNPSPIPTPPPRPRLY